MLATLLIGLKMSRTRPDLWTVLHGPPGMWIASPSPADHDDWVEERLQVAHRRRCGSDAPTTRRTHVITLASNPFSCRRIGVRMTGKEHPVDVFVLRDDGAGDYSRASAQCRSVVPDPARPSSTHAAITHPRRVVESPA